MTSTSAQHTSHRESTSPLALSSHVILRVAEYLPTTRCCCYTNGSVFSRPKVMPSLVYARPAGKQAEVINILLKDFVEGHPVSDQRLKEVLGHTPVQVHPCPRLEACWHVTADMTAAGISTGLLNCVERLPHSQLHAALCMHTAQLCIHHGTEYLNELPACTVIMS